MTKLEDELRLAAQIVVGQRPSGGPYVVEVHDGERGMASQENMIRVTLTEYDDLSERVVCTGMISGPSWRELLCDEMAKFGHSEITLREWHDLQQITYLWICGVGCPGGQELRHDTDTEDSDSYCDFSELSILDTLWDLSGTVDENGTWVWNGKGDVRDWSGNTIYNVKARR